MDKSWKNPWTNFGQRLRKPAVREPNITKINSMDSLLTRAEELDFRRDLMEYTPESFSGGQIIGLLHEQRRICDAMEREVREDFASHGHELQERLLESLEGAGGHDRLWREIYLTGNNRN